MTNNATDKAPVFHASQQDNLHPTSGCQRPIGLLVVCGTRLVPSRWHGPGLVYAVLDTHKSMAAHAVYGPQLALDSAGVSQNPYVLPVSIIACSALLVRMVYGGVPPAAGPMVIARHRWHVGLSRVT